MGAINLGQDLKLIPLPLNLISIKNPSTIRRQMNLKIIKKQRYKIEDKNAELKQSHAFQICKFTGLLGMKIQAYITAIVVNCKRIVKLTQIKEEELKRNYLKLVQILDFLINKKKGAYYFKNCSDPQKLN